MTFPHRPPGGGKAGFSATRRIAAQNSPLSALDLLPPRQTETAHVEILDDQFPAADGWAVAKQDVAQGIAQEIQLDHQEMGCGPEMAAQRVQGDARPELMGCQMPAEAAESPQEIG